MANGFCGIDHIGIAVRDLAAAKAAYLALGFPVSEGEGLPERGLEVVFVDTGAGRLELLAPMRPDSEISRFLAQRGEGLHHVCVRVADLDAKLAELTAHGARLIDATPRPGAHGARVAFVHPKSAAGVLLELAEQPPNGA